MKKIIVKILVSVSLFSLLIWKVDEQEVLHRVSQMDIKYAAIVALLIIVHYFTSSFRWRGLIVFANSKKANLAYLVNLYFIGSFFNNFMPTSIGGDVYKVIKLGKRIESKTNAFSSVFAERFCGVVVLFIISLASLAKILGWLIAPILLAGLLGIFLGLKFLKILSSKFSLIRDVVSSLKEYQNKKSALFNALLVSILVQMLAIFSQYYVFVSIGVHPPLAYSLFVLPVITLASFFIPSLNGIGVQDYLYVQLFASVGIASETALTASILYHILRMLVSLLGGVIYALGWDE